MNLPLSFATAVTLTVAMFNIAGAAAPMSGGPGSDDPCTIEITVDAPLKFIDRFPCRYSNYPVYRGDRLTWDIVIDAGHTFSLVTGKMAAAKASLSLWDARLPRIGAKGQATKVPLSGRPYDLGPDSKNGWYGVVEVFPTPTDMLAVKCFGGFYPGKVHDKPYVAETRMRATWSEVGKNGEVVHGMVRFDLSCAKMLRRGPSAPLGRIGRAVIKF
jgi:hypothetical protein